MSAEFITYSLKISHYRALFSGSIPSHQSLFSSKHNPNYRKMSTEFMINFLAGGVSGAVAKTCTAPIERVKLIIQTQDANPKIISGEVARYTGIVDCFSRVAKEQGIGAFWRGNLTNVIRYFPTQAFNFAFKDGIKSLFPKADKNKEFAKFFAINVASGGLAGAGSLMIVYPLDYARTRLASDVGAGKQQFNGLFDCLKKTIAGSGIGGLYNGIGVSVMGIIPYRGAYFGLFDTLSGLNPYQKEKNNVIRAGSKFACAQTSAIAAGYLSYPFDTIRRRLQMQSEKPKDQWRYKGTADCFAKILKDEGTAALFKGAGANALRTVGAAMVLVLYSEITGAVATE
jgi:solute carrier family 25 (adenine nucleotide translocator) protein 4/5/6/31